MALQAFVITLVVVYVTSALSVEGYRNQNLTAFETLNRSFDNEFSFSNGVHLLYKIYKGCNKESLLMCLKLQLVIGLDRAIYYPRDLRVMKGIKFVRNNDLPHKAAVSCKSKNEIEMELPRSIGEKNLKLNTMISDRIATLLQSRILKVQDSFEGNEESSAWERRGKKDKKNSGAFIMIPLLLSGTFIPIAYGALAFLAGKALIVSKLALVLASIIGIKKLLNSNNFKESQHEVVVSSGHNSGSGWGRDIDLTYISYSPQSSIKDQYN